MFKKIFRFSENKIDTHEDPATAVKRQRQTGILVAGIFAILGLAFLIYDIYIVFVVQKGRFDLSDKVLMPVAALMFLIAAAGLWLIRSDRFSIGAKLLFYFFVLVPPVIAVLLLQSIAYIAVLFIVLLAFILIGWVLPAINRRWAIIAAVVAISLCLAIEFWDPAFRTGTGLGNFAITATVLAGLAILAISVRQAIIGNIRTKLVVAFVLVVTVAVGVVVYLNIRNSQAALTSASEGKLLTTASQLATRFDDFIKTNLDIVRTEAQTPDLVEYLSLRANNQPVEGQSAHIAAILQSFVQRDNVNITSYALLDRHGMDVADTFSADIGVDKSNRDYYITPLQTGQPFVSPIKLSPTRPGDIAIYFSNPVKSTSGEIIGVLRFSYNAKKLQDLIVQANGLAGAQSFAVLLDENYIRLAHGTTPDLIFKSVVPLDPALLAELQIANRVPAGTAQDLSTNLPDLQTSLKNMEADPVFVSASAALGGKLASTAVVKMKTQSWFIYVRLPQAIFLAPINASTRTSLFISLIIIIMTAAVAVFIAQLIAAPITRLNEMAKKVATGDLTVEAQIESRDEIGMLAVTFNNMTSQLRDLIGSLEQRVTDRTKALATSTEVSHRLSTILDQKTLVKEVVEQLQSAFHYYHAHIYLLDATSGDLLLAGGTGEAGQTLLAKGHKIPKGRGLVGRAAETKNIVLVSDTNQDPDWLPNPLLPETKSEIAVPILAGEAVLGVLDVQNNIVDSLGQQDVDLISAIAGQVAVALQNSSLYSRAEASMQEAQSLVEYAPEAIVVVDLVTGCFAEPNENAVKLYGLPREELVKVGPAQMSPPTQPDGRDSTEKALERIGAAMEGSSPVFDWVHRNAQGQDIQCEVRLVRIPGERPRVRASVNDITERKRSEDLTRRRAQQQESLNLISQKIQGATTVDGALQIAVRELGRALGTQTGVRLKLASDHAGPEIVLKDTAL